MLAHALLLTGSLAVLGCLLEAGRRLSKWKKKRKRKRGPLAANKRTSGKNLNRKHYTTKYTTKGGAR